MFIDIIVYSYDMPVYYGGGQEVEYTLTEAAMDGYTATIDATEEDFTVTNTHTVAVSSPKTGDNTPLAFWLAAAVMALIGMRTVSLMADWRRKKA